MWPEESFCPGPRLIKHSPDVKSDRRELLPWNRRVLLHQKFSKRKIHHNTKGTCQSPPASERHQVKLYMDLCTASKNVIPPSNSAPTSRRTNISSNMFLSVSRSSSLPALSSSIFGSQFNHNNANTITQSHKSQKNVRKRLKFD